MILYNKQGCFQTYTTPRVPQMQFLLYTKAITVLFICEAEMVLYWKVVSENLVGSLRVTLAKGTYV